MNTIRKSKGMDQDQDRHHVGPDLRPNCLQRLSADAKIAVSKKELIVHVQLSCGTRCLYFDLSLHRLPFFLNATSATVVPAKSESDVMFC